MSDHITHTHQLSNLREVSNYLLRVSTKDRQLMITQWVNMLIRTGVADSTSSACLMIGQDIGMTREAVQYHYKKEIK